MRDGIGITGHIYLTQATRRLVRAALAVEISQFPIPVHGVTCLAPGVDQMFVDAILEFGGTYDVIVPARDYRDRMVGARDRYRFDRLLAGAKEKEVGDFDHSCPAAFAAANAMLVERCKSLIAVWDGKDDDRPGTTASAVALARQASLDVKLIWPAGARRSVQRSGPSWTNSLPERV